MDIHFGVDYYPEHWDRERWDTDASLMEEMGIQAVRMAEFSWHKLEPEEGVFDFGWLDEVIELLAGHGIKTILGTPTAAPPAWMIQKYPDILPIDREGRRRGFGGRHHTCHSNPEFRHQTKQIVEAMASHYGKNPNVIGWQPDNELGNSHHDLCTCENCRKAFSKWLEKKYQSIDVLNACWGNAFWSQELNDFSEVAAPRITVCGENPSAMLDWKQFCSDLIVDFFETQANIIRRYSEGQFVTHNFMGFADKVNYYDLGKRLDFVSHDQYPGILNGKKEPDFAEAAAQLDVVRGYKDQTFWIMEQQSGIPGWQVMFGRTPAPGQLSAWTLQSVAHGADAIVYFRWRTCAYGTEQYWHGILPHSGIPGRRYYELKDTIQEMTPLMERMKGSMPKSEVGIVFSFRQAYALQIQPNHPELTYTGQLMKYYRALKEKNISVDFVPEDGDFEKYKLLIAPLQYIMTPELEDKYFSYVEQGGHLILTMRTGVKDEHNICMTQCELPGRLAELTGIQVKDYDCLVGASVDICFDGKIYRGNLWSDLLQKQEDVETLAVYHSEFYSGEPCITRHSYGKGLCYYIATEPEEDFMQVLMQDITERAEVSTLGATPHRVEVAAREKDGKRWIFIINHTNQVQEVDLYQDYTLVKGKKRGVLEPFEVHILFQSV